jgi:hypothetical protein
VEGRARQGRTVWLVSAEGRAVFKAVNCTGQGCAQARAVWREGQCAWQASGQSKSLSRAVKCLGRVWRRTGQSATQSS